ncbi:MAG: 2Fe-2S iron-sulfur cluster binding domain-containing protein [Acidocella sp.]|nr:2Fe-2S iron-sulfur cluster binding domain-containing protein [Acidocella sp.]
MLANLTVVIDGTISIITVLGGQTLMAAAEANGLDLPNVCRQGSCGACMARLLEGSVEMPDRPVLSKRDRDLGFILACQAVPSSENLTISYDE